MADASTTAETKKTPKDKKVKIRKIQKELHKKQIHEKRIEVSQQRRHEEKNPEVQRYNFIKSKLDPTKTHYSENEICDFLEEYMKRYDDELRTIQELHKQYKQRPKASREDIILKIKKEEFEAFTTNGLLAPDLTKKKNLTKFMQWDGDIKHVAEVPVRRFKRPEASLLSFMQTPVQNIEIPIVGGGEEQLLQILIQK